MTSNQTAAEPPSSLVFQTTIEEMLSYAKTVPDGCFVEVGVYKGGTAWHLWQLCERENRQLFLYDTFTGIPYADESVDSHKVGDFGDTSAEAVKSAIPKATVVAGVFPSSAVEMPPIAFVHIDADQYQSVKEASEYLFPRMVSGGIIWFDDFDCLPGAAKAVYDVFDNVVQQAPISRKAFVRK